MTRLELDDIPPQLLLRINSPEYWEWLQILRDNWIDSYWEREAKALGWVIEYDLCQGTFRASSKSVWWFVMGLGLHPPGEGDNQHKTWAEAMRWLIGLYV